MSDGKWWWCAYLQAVTKRGTWPSACPLCGREVSEQLSSHHDLFVLISEVPWGNF